MTILRIQHSVFIETLGDMPLAKKLDYAKTLETDIETQFPQANVSVYLTRNKDLIENGSTRVDVDNESTPTNAIIDAIQKIAAQMDSKRQLVSWHQ
ncbi:MAG: hypothetical protein V7717_11865 [Porticoccaceae bacterium]